MANDRRVNASNLRRRGARVSLVVVKTLEARYENGVLRPSEKLTLQPGERVKIIVIRHADQSRWDLTRLAGTSEGEAALSEEGLGEWARELDGEDHR